MRLCMWFVHAVCVCGYLCGLCMWFVYAPVYAGVHALTGVLCARSVRFTRRQRSHMRCKNASWPHPVSRRVNANARTVSCYRPRFQLGCAMDCTVRTSARVRHPGPHSCVQTATMCAQEEEAFEGTVTVVHSTVIPPLLIEPKYFIPSHLSLYAHTLSLQNYFHFHRQ